jgi:hypothetical protein
LRLQNGTFTNTGGVIEATGSGSTVEFSNAKIVSGRLSSDLGATLRHLGGSTFSDVTLGSGSSLELLNNTVAHFTGTLVNNASLLLASAGNFTDFLIDGDVTLDGGGRIALGNNSNNRIYASGTTNLLTNKNNTIEGSGQIGVGLMGLVNQSTIRANQLTPLIIDPSTAGVVNTGLLRADSGATLQLQNGSITNTGGTIESFGAGSIVNFSSASVTNGLLRSSDGGVLRNIASSTFKDVTLGNGAMFHVLNATSATFAGTLNNGGTVQLQSAGNFTDLLVGTGGLTLVGGSIDMGANANNRIYSPTGTTTLINQSAAIRGAGQLGVGLTRIDNRSLIEANISGATLTIDPNASGVANTGTISASNGGIVRLRSGGYDNNGGSITAGAGSRIEFEGANVTGGTLSGAVLRNLGGSSLSTLRIASGSNFEIPNATALTLTGAIANNGAVFVQSLGNLTDLVIGSGGATLTGHGVIDLSNNGNNRIYGSSSANLLNNVDNTIRGSGQLGVGLLTLANSGTIEANQSTPLTVNLASNSGFTNHGILRATNGASLIFTDGLANAAGIQVHGNSTFATQAAFAQTGGATSLEGGTFSAASAAFQGGALHGHGTVAGPVTNAALIAPGANGVAAGIGALTFSHALTLTPTSLLHLELGGVNSFDRISAQSMSLNGLLAVSFTSGFQFAVQATDTFTLLSTVTPNGLSGMFTGLANGARFATADGAGTFQVNYLASSLTISNFQAVPEPSTYLLLAAGAVVLLAMNRRRRSE